MAISRTREYEADRAGAEISRQPVVARLGAAKDRRRRAAHPQHAGRAQSRFGPPVHRQPAVRRAHGQSVLDPSRMSKTAWRGCRRWRARWARVPASGKRGAQDARTVVRAATAGCRTRALGLGLFRLHGQDNHDLVRQSSERGCPRARRASRSAGAARRGRAARRRAAKEAAARRHSGPLARQGLDVRPAGARPRARPGHRGDEPQAQRSARSRARHAFSSAVCRSDRARSIPFCCRRRRSSFFSRRRRTRPSTSP